ncbi:MAG: hypothetical protein ACODAD_00130 [Planctomycetota bacterium]
MPIELTCTGCGQTLRVGDEHAGKKARCPQCGAVVPVPSGEAPAAPLAESSPFGNVDSGSESSNPFADFPAQSSNPYQSPTSSLPTGSVEAKPSHYYKPHRGGLILTFGILGLFCCAPLGIAAWVMGSADLKEIRGGQMDPGGQGLTQAGMILGIIATIFFAIGILIRILMVAGRMA